MKSGRSRGASSIATTAALSVAILIAATGSYIGEKMQKRYVSNDARKPLQIQAHIPEEDADGNGTPDWKEELTRGGMDFSATASSTDPAASIGESLVNSLVSGYVSLKEYGSYTPSEGEELAETLATNFKAPGIATVHTAQELTIDYDSSQERILRYRSDMRDALSGIVDLEAEPEFSLFARFIQTNDAKWLIELSKVASQYRAAEKNLLAVSVPSSASDIHLRAVNAVGEFATTLERLVRFANDPLASMALLRTYNESEREFLLAFDALAKFYVDVSN